MRNLERISRQIVETGGATVNWRVSTLDRPSPLERYIVGVSPKGFEIVRDIGDCYDWRRVAIHLQEYLGGLAFNGRDVDRRGNYLGAWIDDGRLYLDISRAYASRSTAEMVGKRSGQLAIYDSETGEAILLA